MARTIDTIYQAMITEKANHSELDVYTSSSATAIWKLILYVVAVCQYTLERLWDSFQTEIETIIDAQRVGGLQWYVEKALEFQYGDNLVWQNNCYEYAIVDATKQIITHAAAVETGGIIILKVKKSTGALDAIELAAFMDYVSKIKFAGCRVNILSYSADLLSLKVTVWYNPMLIDSDGILLSDGTTKPIEDAINNYNNNLPFNGTVNLSSLEDDIQEAIGANDALITEAKAGRSLPLIAITNNNYQTVAGYIELATGQTEISYCDANGNVINTVTI